jgi:hypothetical protein
VTGLSPEVDFEVREGAGPRVPTSAATVALVVGVTERGPFGARLTTSFEAWKNLYGGYTLNGQRMVAAVEQYYANGGRFLRTSRVTHFVTPGDPTSTAAAAGTLPLPSAAAAPSAGYVESSSQPFNLEPGWSLNVAFEAGGDQTVGPVTATAASVESAAEPFVLSDGMTFTIGGATKTISSGEFVDVGAATAEEVKAVLDPFLLANSVAAGALLTTGNTKVKLQSTKRGSGATFTLGGTMLAALGGTFTAGVKTGTGNVADVDAATSAEVAAMITPTNGAVSSTGGKVRWTSATTGASSTAQVKNTSTAGFVAALGLDNAVHTGSSGAAVNTWRLDGKTRGAYANDLTVEVRASTDGDPLSRNLFVVKNGTVLERHFNLSSDPASARYAPEVVNDAETGSDLLTLVDLTGDADPYTVGLPPAVGVHGPFTGGDDGLVGLDDADFVGAKSSSVSGTGIYAFDVGEESGELLLVPGRGTSVVHNGMVAFCAEARGGRCFAVLDPPQDQTAEQMDVYVTQTAAIYQSTRLGAVYYPELLVANPSREVYGTGATITAPPSGLVAGLCARVDAAKVGGPFDHPAGADSRYLPRGVLGFATATGEAPSKADRDLLFPHNVNCVSREGLLPIFVDGARTLDMEGEFGSVGESRGVIFVRKQLGGALRRFSHRPITRDLLDAMRDTTFAFLLELTAAGAFASRVPSEAFYVDFGPGLNPPSVARARRTVGEVGLATAKPNEFTKVYITEDRRALTAELAAAQA